MCKCGTFLLYLFISIHPPRAGRDVDFHLHGLQLTWISIHPPRAGRDADHSGRGQVHLNFNPPSPCGEGRVTGGIASGGSGFQSTLPVRGGTETASSLQHSIRDFNPPSPCGEGPKRLQRRGSSAPISIHPPRAGRDADNTSADQRSGNFNPPSPCGEGRSIRVPWS